MRCSQRTRRGRQCRNRARAGTDRCAAHIKPQPAAAIEQLLQMLRAGNRLEAAAAAVGLGVDELRQWPELAPRIERARAEFEVRAVAQIMTQAATSWPAASWLLERQLPARYARPATRNENEKPPAPAPVVDGLDELAGKRDARRAQR